MNLDDIIKAAVNDIPKISLGGVDYVVAIPKLILQLLQNWIAAVVSIILGVLGAIWQFLNMPVE